MVAAAIFNATGVLDHRDNDDGSTRSADRTAGEGNVISGNTGIGINVTSGCEREHIQGNLVGLDPAGNLDLGNTGDGIILNGVTGNTVGGRRPARGT